MSLIGRKVTVLGAGVAGLAVARALALRGAQVTVLEQADAIREVGAGLQISPNGAVVLRALGLGEALDKVSTRAEAVSLRDGYTGSEVMRLDVARLRPEEGYHFLHRADLIELLHQGALDAGVEIRLQSRVTAVELNGPAPRLVMGGETVEAGLVIGADGLHSVARAALLGPEAPFFTHQVAWRAVIPGDGESDAGPNVAEVHMGEKRHLVSYPLRGGALRNIAAVEERRGWVDESWSRKAEPDELRKAFAGFSPRVRAWLDKVEDVWLWGLFRHEVARVWQKPLAEGGLAILGDAAHPTLPFLAQGATMALEDAWVLTDQLAGTDRIAAGLAAYEQARIPRCQRIVAAATSNARNYHLGGMSRTIGHLGLRLAGALAPGMALRQFDWLYGFDVTKT